MLIAPDIYTHSFAISGTGAAFLSDQTLLADGRPSQVTRCRWISGAQTIASTVRITDTITNSLGGTPSIGAVAVLGISGLPLGLKVVFNGDTTHQVNLVKCPSGGLMAVYIPVAAFSTSSLTIDFYNNVAGSTAVSASALFEIGEICPAVRWVAPNGINQQWKLQAVDPSVTRNSGDNQPYKLTRVPYRTGLATIETVTWEDAYGTPPSGQMNLQDLSFALARSTRCIFIPRWQNASGIDQTSINALSIFGGVTNPIGAIENQNGVFFKQQLQFREYPHGD